MTESNSSPLSKPYCEINKKVVEKMELRRSGISMIDIRNFFLWLFTMDSLPPSYIFIGNKPSIQNVTVVVAKEEEVINLDKIDKDLTQIPVRQSPVPDLWDQYLLYGVQTGKRLRSDTPDEPVERLSFVSMCLTEEERKENDYVVVKGEDHRNILTKAGYLFIDTPVTDDESSRSMNSLIVRCLVSLDCEMVETEGGRDELARVSLVSREGVLLDEYVLPEGKVTDYRTQYSGITPAILADCKNTFRDIQQRVFQELTKKPTILVGHSLENDLAVLKLIHTHVIDSAIRYVHPTPGHKHSLRYLSVTYLNRSIQNKNGGHDSVEDAKAALDLVVFYANGGLPFKSSFENAKPFPNKRTNLLQQIAKSNPKQRIVFLAWNDYVMSVSQTSAVGDMITLKNRRMIIPKLQSLSKASNVPRFTFVYGVEYHFREENGSEAKEEVDRSDVLDIKELVDMFRLMYSNSVLCLLLMKSDEKEPAGHFIPIMNSG